MQETIDYKEIMNLGFKRFDFDDTVFFDQNGYHYFWCDLKLHKKIVAHWECENKTVVLRRMGKNGDILSELPVRNIDELERYINFFKQ